MNRLHVFSPWQIGLALLGNAILVLLLSLAVSAQEATPPGVAPVTDDQVNAVAKQLYCPVCENIPLDVCPTPACAQWRALIRQMLGEGKSEAEIKEYFVAQFGDRVLGAPPARGLNWLVYLVPPAAILAGAFILYRAMRSWKTSSPTPGSQPGSGQTSSDEYVARLEEELRRR
jgi:cytochrome c-type biogenesis protein CcmH